MVAPETESLLNLILKNTEMLPMQEELHQLHIHVYCLFNFLLFVFVVN